MSEFTEKDRKRMEAALNHMDVNELIRLIAYYEDPDQALLISGGHENEGVNISSADGKYWVMANTLKAALVSYAMQFETYKYEDGEWRV